MIQSGKVTPVIDRTYKISETPKRFAICKKVTLAEKWSSRGITQRYGKMTTSKIDNSQRTAAKVAGWSGLLTFAIVVFGNYVLLNPLIVPGNAAATAQNIAAHQTQFRVTAVCFLTYSLGVDCSAHARFM